MVQEQSPNHRFIFVKQKQQAKNTRERMGFLFNLGTVISMDIMSSMKSNLVPWREVRHTWPRYICCPGADVYSELEFHHH